jgi:serine/threonine-protein kinase HipA
MGADRPTIDALPPEFFLVHQGVAREGPGNDTSTREALRRLPAPPASPRILDLGCGPGFQSLVLARELGSRVVAVDLHRPFLDRLENNAREEGLDRLIETRCADIGTLEDEPSSVDLIWCESAVWIVGFVEGIRRWRPLLRPGGLMVISEAVWLTDERPAEAVQHWTELPGMTTVAENVRQAEGEGMRTLDTFLLPPEAWWEYYAPLRRRVAELRPQAARGSALAQVLDETEQEIGVYERHGASFGYAFFSMQKP